MEICINANQILMLDVAIGALERVQVFSVRLTIPAISMYLSTIDCTRGVAWLAEPRWAWGPFRQWCMRGDEEVIGFVIANETGDIFSAGRFPPAVHHQIYHLLTEWDSRFGDGIVNEISVHPGPASIYIRAWIQHQNTNPAFVSVSKSKLVT